METWSACQDSKSSAKTDCTEIVITGARWGRLENLFVFFITDTVESLWRLKRQAGWIRCETDQREICSHHFKLLWLREDGWFMQQQLYDGAPPRCAVTPVQTTSYRKTHNSPIINLDWAREILLSNRRQYLANVTTNPSSGVCFGREGESCGQVKHTDKHGWESPCFKKRNRPKLEAPDLFFFGWVWTFARVWNPAVCWLLLIRHSVL